MTECFLPSCDAKTNFKYSAKIRQLQSDLLIAYQDEDVLGNCLKELESFIKQLECESINEGKAFDYSYITYYINKIESNLLFNPPANNALHIKSICVILSHWLLKYKSMFPKYRFAKEKIPTPLLPNFYEYCEDSVLKNIRLNITFPFATSYHECSGCIYACVIDRIKNIYVFSKYMYLYNRSSLCDCDIDSILCSQDSTPYLDYPTVELIYKGTKVNINMMSVNFTIDNPIIKLKYKNNPIYISEKCLIEGQFLDTPPCTLLYLTIEVYGDLIYNACDY